MQIGDQTKQDESVQLPAPFVGTFNRNIADAVGNVAYTGIGFTPSYVQFNWALTGAGKLFGNGSTDGISHAFRKNNRNNVLTDFSIGTSVVLTVTEIGGSDASDATFVSFDSDGFTLNWAKAGTPVGTILVTFTAFK